MNIVIEIEDYDKEWVTNGYYIPNEINGKIAEVIINGKPLVDVLDKIKVEIERQEKWLLQAGYTAYNTDIAFDAIKSVLAERSE